ncbi:hypothetical protein [Lacimicrobium alkaliphilum]|uniref:Uncharacterized protein n=1 Tax=Lacimicrobium alkaliphilum TaxID=1526571 RepID=A0A0U2Z5S5_9ALTE|nr:hypothetical protein [Lacimicrobium alkaliphilum]ALS98243.1 hypothetical protein AT746_08270 [Lacimicrobium alkaliphilum]
MERLHKNTTTALFISAIALAMVSILAVNILPQFQEILRGFDAKPSFWVGWVYVSYSYWWVLAAMVFLHFMLSLIPDIKYSRRFQKVSVQVAMSGLVVSFLLIIFSILAIYLPVLQSA